MAEPFGVGGSYMLSFEAWFSAVGSPYVSRYPVSDRGPEVPERSNGANTFY